MTQPARRQASHAGQARHAARIRLTELNASDVQGALAVLAARLSTRTAQIAHNVLVRAIRHAERDDLVGRNVAALVDAPKGQQAGRPSKSLTLEQAVTLMTEAKGTALEAYIVVSLLSGARTEDRQGVRHHRVATRRRRGSPIRCGARPDPLAPSWPSLTGVCSASWPAVASRARSHLLRPAARPCPVGPETSSALHLQPAASIVGVLHDPSCAGIASRVASARAWPALEVR
jgi:hypothetical protein